MRKIKSITALALIASMCGSLVAFGGETEASESVSGKVGISMPTKELERWNKDASQMEQGLEDLGIDVEVTFSNNDINKQVNDIQTLIGDGVDVLIIAAIDGDSLANVLKDAEDNDIPVIAYDRLIMNTDAVTYYTTCDNFWIGQMQGEYLKEALDLDNAGDKTFNIEIMAGDPADSNAPIYYSAGLEVLQPYIDAGTVNILSGQTSFDQTATVGWDTTNALKRMENILGSFYSDGTVLDAVLCSNDSLARGVTQAIDDNYWNASKQFPLITGQDADEANLRNIIDGKQAMTVFPVVPNEVMTTVGVAKAILEGKTPDASLVDEYDFEVSYDDTNYNNGVKTLPSFCNVPVVVTKDTIQKELIDTGFYKEGDDGYPVSAE